MKKPISAILIGAGNRGAQAYAPYALRHPEELRFTAVAEPDPGRRSRFAAQYQIPAENCFESWEPLLARPQLAESALICTQDWQHTAPAVAALSAGYHVLLEKPMVMNAAEARGLIEARDRSGKLLVIAFPGSLSPQIRKR